MQRYTCKRRGIEGLRGIQWLAWTLGHATTGRIFRSRLLIVMLFGDPRSNEPRFCAPPIYCVHAVQACRLSVLSAPHLILVHSISKLCVLQSMLSRLHLSQSCPVHAVQSFAVPSMLSRLDRSQSMLSRLDLSLSRLHLSQSTLIYMSCSTMFFVFALPFAMLVSPYVGAWSLLPLLPARSSSSV